MARNRHGAQKVKAFGFDCPECQDRGYTWQCPEQGLITACTCARGKLVEAQVDEARTNLQTCRALSREAEITPFLKVKI